MNGILKVTSLVALFGMTTALYVAGHTDAAFVGSLLLVFRGTLE